MIQKLIIILIFMTSTLAQSASFDCKKATTKIEKMICGNEELSKLDEKLSETYKNVFNQGNGSLVQVDQINWLKYERERCSNTNCLIKTYTQRITDLQNWEIQTAPFNNLDGYYSIDHEYSDFEGSYSIPVTDCLWLQRTSSTEVDFAIEITHGYGHSCSISGTAIQQQNELTFNDEENFCFLKFIFKTNSVAISPDSCRNFCGANASLSSEFLKSSKSKKSCLP